MAKPFRKPDRNTVVQIIKEEARAHHVSPAAVTNASTRRKAVAARQSAIARIIQETGCSERGLSMVWGLDKSVIRRVMEEVGRTTPACDQDTLSRLAWQYGWARARLIAAGQDPKTQTDLSAWARLGQRSAA
ncbi:hypothetical protein [Phenylobacterium deserti]|uniref:Uncharacterized protein n=1 Tax=Phenylobacterium deserti TaxID=1914756 RepID=A0A328ABL1_9CAUL|nr:hypothetical protein [Phenylobacterium deserti]RAK52112.1 hypothetical protein DJ018_13230 [Phenylobacterium deserti]